MGRSEAHESDNEQELTKKIRAGSHLIDDYVALSRLLCDSGREEEAIPLLEKALALPIRETERAQISSELAWMLYGLAEDERAIAMAQVALSSVPTEVDPPEALRIRGLIHTTLAHAAYYRDRGASDQAARVALEAFEGLVTSYSDSEYFVEACLHAAQLCMLLEDCGKVVALYDKALNADPSERNKLECLFGIGNALRHQGRYVEAEERLREALGYVEADKRLLPKIYLELGSVYHLADRAGEALVSFEQFLKSLHFNPALRRDRESLSEVRWALGNLYYDAKRYAEALSTFREGLPDFPAHVYCHTLLSIGHCHYALGQHDKARDCYEEVLASEHATNEEKAAAQEGLSALPPLRPPRVH